jgi:hypothetical protein
LPGNEQSSDVSLVVTQLSIWLNVHEILSLSASSRPSSRGKPRQVKKLSPDHANDQGYGPRDAIVRTDRISRLLSIVP